MATVDETVREAILTYPSVFQSRADVLHHMLCVIGTNCDWKDGEMINPAPAAHWTPERYIADAERKLEGHSPFIQALMRDFWDEQIESMLKVTSNVDMLMHSLVFRKADIYVQHESAALMNIPEDVTEDWAAACNEMKDIAEQYGWKF